MTVFAQRVTDRRPSSARALAGAVQRNNLRLRRNSASLVSALVIPGMSMLAFWIVFGHAASASGFDYALFLTAASMFQPAARPWRWPWTWRAGCSLVCGPCPSGPWWPWADE